MSEAEDKGVAHCNHFVIRKKRYCRISVIPGGTFCAEHQPPTDTNDVESNKIRIVCPLDSKHTCYAHNLKKHLKICNARPKAPLPFIQKGVNSGQIGGDNSYKLLTEFPTSEIKELITKINEIYPDFNIHIRENFTAHKIVEDEMAKPEYGAKTKKHLTQTSAILGLLQDANLVQDNTCFLEFGAGRGQLSYWLAQAVPNCSFLLVERASPKHKKDNKLEKIQRIRADIADLLLDKIETVNNSGAIVGITKHLCGDATDLALRCLCNSSHIQDKTAGCVMTFCCHHRCRWGAFTGREFFENFGLGKSDFEMMCGMTSWATCGTGYSRDKKEISSEEINNDRDKEIGLNRTQKEEIGMKCKMMLNWGRLKYLEGLGFKCDLFYYVSRDVSLENVCIVARKNEIKETSK